jgi:predicted transcriptional regulator of viral defense system
MSKKDLLFQIAQRQQGYFTSLQAEECGFPSSNFHRYLISKEWIRELHGIYRLARYPMTDRPELVLWSLWSRDKKGQVRGVWSHETALDIFELSDVMPSKLHMSVPKKFRKRTSIPKVLALHYADLRDVDIQAQQGYLITTPLRTLIDIAQAGELSYDLIKQAVHDALRKGMVSRRELNQANLQNNIPILLRILDEFGLQNSD